MKYGIYKGDIVEVEDPGGMIVNIVQDGEATCASRKDIVEVPEEVYKEIGPELKAARQELSNIKNRIFRLDDEYHKKLYTLQQMMMDARQKEIAIVNRFLKGVKLEARDGYD